MQEIDIYRELTELGKEIYSVLDELEGMFLYTKEYKHNEKNMVRLVLKILSLTTPKVEKLERCYICGYAGNHITVKSPNDIINYDICVKCWDKYFMPPIKIVIELLKERGVYGK